VSHDETGFAEFFDASWDPCLRAAAATLRRLRRIRAAVDPGELFVASHRIPPAR
jgi:hypothetical protein